MKPTIRTPYFEVGVKNYIYGDTVLEYAIAADKAALPFLFGHVYITFRRCWVSKIDIAYHLRSFVKYRQRLQ